MENIIEINGLTKTYNNGKGITDVSFNVKKGEIFGFIGPNGAGKSTTIRTLLGLIHANHGSVQIFGKDAFAHQCDIAQEIGYLPSDVFYYDKMRVKDLLAYSASFYAKDCRARIKELAETMGLDLHAKIDDLSFGNKKKVGIVQGLLHSPDLIILDEPTSGLDPLMQHTFFEILRAENQRGVTILFSSHILGEVQRLCDRVAIIKDGEIIRVSEMEAIRGENYKRIEIVGKDEQEVASLSLPGIKDFIRTGNEASFLYNGNVQQLIAVLGSLQLQDLTIREPDLEEVFMHYYE